MMRWLLAIGLLLPTAALAQEQHSALAAHGEAASQIAALTWVLFALAGFVFALVAAATWIALAGPPRFRAMLASRQTIVIAGFVFPVVVLTVLLFTGLRLTAALTSDAANPLKILVRGEQWWWRVSYTLPDGGRFESANEIRIPVGRAVQFELTSADVIHSFWIPSLAGKMDMIPGRVTSLRLSAERPGIYRGICAEYCGGPHAWMALSVIAVPQAEFDDWLSKATQPPSLSDVATPGRRAFHARRMRRLPCDLGHRGQWLDRPGADQAWHAPHACGGRLADERGQYRALHRRRPEHQARQQDAAVQDASAPPSSMPCPPT